MTTACPVPEVEVFGLNLSAGGLFYQLLSVCLQTAKVLAILLLLCSLLISTDKGFFYCVFNLGSKLRWRHNHERDTFLILLCHQIFNLLPPSEKPDEKWVSGNIGVDSLNKLTT